MTTARLRDPGLIPVILGPLVGLLAVVETSLDPFFGDAALATWASGVVLGAGIVLARWLPLPGAIAAAGCYPIGALLGAEGPGGAAMIGLIGVVGWVAWREPPRRSLLALGSGAAALALTSVLTGKPLWELLFVPAILLPGWLLGLLARRNGARAVQLAELAAQLDAEREANARAAVIEERSRIAREVHDAVAHSVSVMTLQLGGLRRRLADQPDERDIVLGLERLGRQSVEELRGLVGILRDSETAGGPAPQPTLERAEALLAEVRRAGLPVQLEVRGEPRPLPRSLDISAYRILQEALTNVLRHAGAPATAITIEYGLDRLQLSVVNGAGDGRADRSVAGRGGHGIIGMRERVALFEGTLDTGPLPDGGFAVRARLPMRGQ